MLRVLFAITTLSIATATTPVAAQSVVAATQSTQTANAAERSVTVAFKNVRLPDAIKEISRQANVPVMYSEIIVPSNHIVTYSANSVSAGEALRAVLKNTGVVVQSAGVGGYRLARGIARNNVQGVITGRVLDSKTGRGIPGANVSIDNDTRGVSTGEDGTYRITGIATGNHTVVVRLVGYAKQTKIVIVGEGSTLTIDFRLEPSASVLDQVIVTGTIVSTELKAVPNAITVITAKQIEERGITRIDQLFRGDMPGLFAMNMGSNSLLDEVTMFSRGATSLNVNDLQTGAFTAGTNPIKTYVDGVELADAKYLSQIDPRSIERIEILTGPQASTIYGSNALNGVMQIFTKRGSNVKAHFSLDFISGITQNNINSALAPNHSALGITSGVEGRWSYSAGGSIDYVGSWTPAKNTTRYGIFGGSKMDAGKLTADLNVRHAITQNRQRGDAQQIGTAWREEGLVQPVNGSGLVSPTTGTLRGQTFGLTMNYLPTNWWSHEFVIGNDGSSVESIGLSPAYSSRTDTLVVFSHTRNMRSSGRYATTTRLHLGGMLNTTFVLGVDHWRVDASVITARSQVLISNLGNPSFTRLKPATNTGGFVQGQIAFRDALFLTYGIRAEWNPNYGAEAQPNLAPRYGIAYTKELGIITAKARASYGRSTKPPAQGLKLGVLNTDVNVISQYGPINTNVPNLDLGPEFQQGGEGGVELYIGNRATMILTRYNQTVDALVGFVYPADSARSLASNPTVQSPNSILDTDGYGYWYQSQYINIGSIRNQGWELQGSVNVGPVTTRGTYSWTKSRVLGITPRYRALFVSNSEFQVGRSFSYLPEHTWSLGLGYTRNATNLLLMINGITQLYKNFDDLVANTQLVWRDPDYRLRMGLPTSYRALGRGYAMADINVSHRFSSGMEGIMQIQNLTDYYQNDIDISYATIGRQTKIGARLKF